MATEIFTVALSIIGTNVQLCGKNSIALQRRMCNINMWCEKKSMKQENRKKHKIQNNIFTKHHMHEEKDRMKHQNVNMVV